MPRERKWIRLLSTALVGAMLITGVGVADAGPPDLSQQPAAIDWTQSCDEPTWDVTVECGILRLPVDWSQPWAASFDLKVARRKATDPSRRIGVLMVNPGGPGDSAMDFAAAADDYFSPEIQARFDIVGFDPRGIKRSQPIRCSRELLDRQPSLYPRDQREFDQIAAYNRELREDCRRHSGPIFDHADTLAVVHDMDALRRALGEARISYFGHSYGTLIGQQYAEIYGDRIRAMTITAYLDHSLDTRAFLMTSAATIEDSFTEFVRWCDRTPSCALHGRDVGTVWDRLLARADRGEIADPDQAGRRLTATELIGRATSMFKGPRWSQLAALVSTLDAQPLVPGTPAAEPTRPAPLLANVCQDRQMRVRDYPELARLTEQELRLAPHMRGSPAHFPLVGCIGWPDANNPQHRLRITQAPTILMLNSRHDPVSAYSWAINAHRQAHKNSILLTYQGWGHQVYRRSDCTRDAVDTYLIERRPPPHSTHCAAVEPTAS